MNVRVPGDRLGLGRMCRGRPRRVCRTGVSVPESVRWGGRGRPSFVGGRLCSRGKLLGPGARWSGRWVRDGGYEEAEGLPAADRGRRLGAGIAGRAEAYAAFGVTLRDGNRLLWEEGAPTPSAEEAKWEGALGGVKGLFPSLGEGLNSSRRRGVGVLGTSCWRSLSFPFGWGSSVSLSGRMGGQPRAQML